MYNFNIKTTNWKKMLTIKLIVEKVNKKNQRQIILFENNNKVSNTLIMLKSERWKSKGKKVKMRNKT